MDVVIAALVGLVVGSGLNRLIIREPGYVIRDLASAPDDIDDALLDELEEVGDLPAVPVLAVVRPSAWHRRWFPVVEIVTAVLWGVTVHRYGTGSVSLAVLFLVAALVGLAAIDFRVLRIPDRLNFPSIGIGFALIVGVSLHLSAAEYIVGAAIGGVLYAGMLFITHLIYPRGMGWGDVKLAWLMGIYLGWFGWQPGLSVSPVFGVLQFVIWAFGLGAMFGVVVGLPYAIAKRSARTSFPFGPSLAAGCLIVVLFADSFRV